MAVGGAIAIATMLVVWAGARFLQISSAGIDRIAATPAAILPLGGVVHIDAPVAISDAPPMTIERGTLRADPMQIAKALAAQVAGTRATINEIMLEGATIAVNLSAPMRHTGVRPEPGASPILSALTAARFDVLRVRSSTLRLLADDGSGETLTDVTFDAQSRGRGVLGSKGSLKWRGVPIDFDVVAGPAPEGGRFLVKVGAKSKLIEAVFDGTLDANRGVQLVGEAEVQTSDVCELARWLGKQVPPTTGMRALKAKGTFQWANRILAFDRASFTMDGSVATGTLSLETGQPLPQIEGTLAFGGLDLARHLSLPADGHGVIATSPSDWSIALPLLRHIVADLRLSADRVTIPGLDIGPAAVTVSVKRSRLLADIAEMEVDGGRAGGQVTVDMSGEVPRYSIRAKAEGLDATRSLAMPLQPGWLQGKVNVSVDVSGVGQTVGELLHDLAGRAAITVPQGGRMAIDMRAVLASARRTGAVPAISAYRGSTSFSLAEVKTYVRQGVAIVEAGRIVIGADFTQIAVA